MKEVDMRLYPFHFVIILIFLLALQWSLSAATTQAKVLKEGDRIYIVDQTGEHWDISQAVASGYDPNHFEFGIGRHAFQPLGERDWSSRTGNTPADLRVIGVAGHGQAHAYAVEKLRYHETANTVLGPRAILAAY
jgi:hypothetical protein